MAILRPGEGATPCGFAGSVEFDDGIDTGGCAGIDWGLAALETFDDGVEIS